MKAITTEFKEALKGIKEIDAKVTYTIDGTGYELGMEELNSIQPHYNADILKSVMKELELDSNVFIPNGTLINLQVGVKVRNSLNLFDDMIELGNISPSDGTISASTTRTRSKFFIKVQPNTTYRFTRQMGGNRWVIGYKADKTGITDGNHNGYASALGSVGSSTLTFTFTTSSTTEYIKWYDTNSTNLTEQVMISEGSTSVSYEKGAYDYANYGNYIVKESEKQEDTNSYIIKCYDKMLYSMVDYETPTVSGTAITYPITVQNYLSAICSHLGLTLKSSNFVNYNRVIPSELYLDKEGNSLGYKFRDILDELAQVTASTICINEEDDQLEVRYATDTVGKNLLGLTDVSSTTTYGITYSVNNNVITLSGTANNTSGQTAVLIDIPLINIIPLSSGTLTKSLRPTGTYTGVQTSLRGSDTSSAGLWSTDASNNVGNAISKDAYYFRIQINNTISVNCTLQAQVEKGSAVTSFEPFGDTIDEEFFDETDVKFGELYGPINTVVLSRSEDSDNYTKSIPADLTDDLKNAIKIKDNQIMNFDNRSEYADAILNKLYGLSYYTCDYSSKGILYYNVCDKYNASIFGTFYNCIMLNDDVVIEGGVKEIVFAETPVESETDYATATSDDVADRKTKLIVDKANQTITSEISGYEKVKAIVIGTYGLTTDATFKADKTYYISNGDNQYEEYTNYSVGDTVPANTIYELTGSKIQELSGQYSTLDSKIDKTKADITDEYEKYYESQIKQTKDSIEFDFNEKYSDYDSMDAATNGRINEIQKYLRYIRSDNSVRLGMNTENMELVLKNNKMYFYDKSSGQEVAYISENKLYITNAQILKQIQIGNFAFIPRDNGSLGFRKVS